MAFSGQTFSDGNILTAGQMNQMQTNLEQVRTQHKGSSAPPQPTTGIMWLDDSSGPVVSSGTTVDRWRLKLRNVSTVDDASLFITLLNINDNTDLSAPIFRGAMARKSGNQTITNGLLTRISWASTDYDTSGFFNASNNSMNIPNSTIKKVVLTASCVWGPSQIGLRSLVFHKEASEFAGSVRVKIVAVNEMMIVSHPFEVSSGDRYTVAAQQKSGGNLDILDDNVTRFSIRVVE